MAEKTVRWPDESTRVEIDNPQELAFWTRWFRVSAGMLRQAVREVGCRFKDVTQFLNERRVG